MPVRTAFAVIVFDSSIRWWIGDRSFAAAGPRTWNGLPFRLRDTWLSWATFNEHLKTYLFSVAFWDHGAFCDIYDFFVPCINRPAYLLLVAVHLESTTSYHTRCLHSLIRGKLDGSEEHRVHSWHIKLSSTYAYDVRQLTLHSTALLITSVGMLANFWMKTFSIDWHMTTMSFSHHITSIHTIKCSSDHSFNQFLWRLVLVVVSLYSDVKACF